MEATTRQNVNVMNERTQSSTKPEMSRPTTYQITNSVKDMKWDPTQVFESIVAISMSAMLLALAVGIWKMVLSL